MEKQKLVIVGASGQMGKIIINRAFKEGYEILSTIIGPNEPGGYIHNSLGEVLTFKEIDTVNWEQWKSKNSIHNPIFLDFTHKSVIKENYEKVYKVLRLPLIVGTIGIKKPEIVDPKFPIILGTPNLALELANILDIFENNLTPNFLENILFGLTESHQGPDPEKGISGKTEFSGTADRMGEAFIKLGGKLLYKTMIRDPKIQRSIGVKEEYLSGHGWHTYHFMSPKRKWGIKKVLDLSYEIISNARYGTKWLQPVKVKSAIFEVWNESYTFQLRVEHDPYNVWFSTRVDGREPYLDGLFKAVLPEMIHAISCGENKVRDMFDIL